MIASLIISISKESETTRDHEDGSLTAVQSCCGGGSEDIPL